MSAHIDDTLILCEDLTTLQKFKALMLARFERTNEGDVTEYLGCKVIRNRSKKTLCLLQSAYICKDTAGARSLPVQEGLPLSPSQERLKHTRTHAREVKS
eukprot:3154727-Rhodomonas_salina.2